MGKLRISTVILVWTLLVDISPYAKNVNGASTTSESSLMGYYLQLYNSVNSYRSKHTVAALRLNRTLSDEADYVASRIPTNTIDIDDTEGVIYYISPTYTRPPAQQVVDTWYNESSSYDFNNPGYNSIYLSFTQMIWKSSMGVGFGTNVASNRTIIVAKFYPPGNVRGKFRQNVIPRYKKM